MEGRHSKFNNLIGLSYAAHKDYLLNGNFKVDLELTEDSFKKDLSNTEF